MISYLENQGYPPAPLGGIRITGRIIIIIIIIIINESISHKLLLTKDFQKSNQRVGIGGLKSKIRG